MLENIWESNQLSNNGQMVRLLEKELANYLGAEHLSVFCNGTAALQVACRVLRLTGEVITTPFTFAATPHSLVWNSLKPVFCDIEEDTFNINPDLIESLITPETSAIMAVHVFGNPCNVQRIKEIADRYHLKVIYDAAHAFGVKIGNQSICNFGDISMLSLHATKIYHTIEGGALTFNDPDLKERADRLRNFGFENDNNVLEPGTNAKMNEVQAAIGLLLLKKVEQEIEKRKTLTHLYRDLLADIPGIIISEEIQGITANYPYFVIRINKPNYGLSRDELYLHLQKYNIICRKYFYPLCSNFSCYQELSSSSKIKLPVANQIADSVLALPLHGRMDLTDVEKICGIIKKIKPYKPSI
jgi:dTDP-4-amino-4,6-dideoxygalactose transaminase